MSSSLFQPLPIRCYQVTSSKQHNQNVDWRMWSEKKFVLWACGFPFLYLLWFLYLKSKVKIVVKSQAILNSSPLKSSIVYYRAMLSSIDSENGYICLMIEDNCNLFQHAHFFNFKVLWEKCLSIFKSSNWAKSQNLLSCL